MAEDGLGAFVPNWSDISALIRMPVTWQICSNLLDCDGCNRYNAGE